MAVSAPGLTSIPPSAPRGGVLGTVLAGLAVAAACAVLGWMLLLPVAAQTRFAAATGAELRLRGLMGDPFAGRATVTGWTLRADPSPGAALLARGGAAELIAPGWRAAWTAETAEPLVIESLDLHLSEIRLAPDPGGRWPLLAALAALGLPYEAGGRIGVDVAPLRLAHLRLVVDTVVVRDGPSGREVARPVAWRGEFHDLDHARPVVAALLAAARRE